MTGVVHVLTLSGDNGRKSKKTHSWNHPLPGLPIWSARTKGVSAPLLGLLCESEMLELMLPGREAIPALTESLISANVSTFLYSKNPHSAAAVKSTPSSILQSLFSLVSLIPPMPKY